MKRKRILIVTIIIAILIIGVFLLINESNKNRKALENAKEGIKKLSNIDTKKNKLPNDTNINAESENKQDGEENEIKSDKEHETSKSSSKQDESNTSLKNDEEINEKPQETRKNVKK